MSAVAAGGLLGLAAGVGLLIVLARLPIARRVSMADRIAPYVRTGAAPGLSLRRLPVPTSTSRRLLVATARQLDRWLGGRAALDRRLAAAGDVRTVEQYRLSQVLWAATATVPGAAILALGTVGTRPSVSLAGVALVVAGMAGGVAARDAALTREIKVREADMLLELPAVAELLSLAVSAGESPLGALQRVARTGDGPLRAEIGRVLAEVRAGDPLIQALDAFSARTTVAPLARFLDGIVVAVERGTPLADLLRAQAADVREAAKRALMESGGRKEIAMMIPVVFLVLPTVVLSRPTPLSHR